MFRRLLREKDATPTSRVTTEAIGVLEVVSYVGAFFERRVLGYRAAGNALKK